MATEAIYGKVIYRGDYRGARKVLSDIVFRDGVKRAIKSLGRT